jgi:hypothetical protein
LIAPARGGSGEIRRRDGFARRQAPVLVGISCREYKNPRVTGSLLQEPEYGQKTREVRHERIRSSAGSSRCHWLGNTKRSNSIHRTGNQFRAGVWTNRQLVFIHAPDVVNVANGEHPFLANEFGEIDTVSIGFPPDPFLFTTSVWNNTTYNLTSLTLSIIGSAFHPTGSQLSWLITRDPNVDAFFGDANGDGKIGQSDIFSSIVVSDGGKTITLSGGVIPVGGHFTDIANSFTTDGLPFSAGLDTSFDGVLAVPEPATGMLLFTGLGLFWAIRKKHSHLT